MPKNTMLAISALLSAAMLAGAMQDPAKDAAKDASGRKQDARALVQKAAAEYVEALYEVKPELIERCCHKDLVKFGFWRQDAGSDYRGMAMTHAQLTALAGKWNRDGSRVPADAPNKVEVLDLMDQTAVVKVTAVWGVDHMQLARFDGKWQIRHILWQSHPIESR